MRIKLNPRVNDLLLITLLLIWLCILVHVFAQPETIPLILIISFNNLSNASKQNLWDIGASSHVISLTSFKSWISSSPCSMLQIEDSSVGTRILIFEWAVLPLGNNDDAIMLMQLSTQYLHLNTIKLTKYSLSIKVLSVLLMHDSIHFVSSSHSLNLSLILSLFPYLIFSVVLVWWIRLYIDWPHIQVFPNYVLRNKVISLS